ncbi:unnamed protein product [Lactuca saligna]|uniref:Uncharacterized protein n=1 Tax=Lactuca saligna TaxID=75948 RepID=A0AA35YMC8_LACSI|nr:unnamed protein product [Lactuca saligna]
MTKHIDIQYNFNKDHILKGSIKLIFVPSDDEIADVLTKTLDETKFNGFLDKMGMMMSDPQFFQEAWTPTSDSKLSKAGAVSPTSKAPTGPIPSSSKGRSGIFDKDWYDFVNMAHSIHSGQTRAQVAYTIISMCQRVLQIHLPFTFPSDEETGQVFHLSEGAHETTTGDIPDPTIVSDDPQMMFTSDETPNPPSHEDHSDDVMFDNDTTYVGAFLILTYFKMLHKPSSSKPLYDFSLFSSLEESKEEEVYVDANTQGNQDNEYQSNPVDNEEPLEPQDDVDNDEDDKKFESFTSET